MFSLQSQLLSSDSCYLLIVGIKAQSNNPCVFRLLWHNLSILGKYVHHVYTSTRTVDSVTFAKHLGLCPPFSAWEFALLTQSSPSLLFAPHACRYALCLISFLACLVACKPKPIPRDAFLASISRSQHEQTRLWWWAMCKAAFSNLIKGLRYSPLKQRALEAWRNDSGKSTALICKNLHLLAGRGNATRRGRGKGRRLPFRIVTLIELQTPNPKLWHPNVLSQTDLAWSRGLREEVKERRRIEGRRRYRVLSCPRYHCLSEGELSSSSAQMHRNLLSEHPSVPPHIVHDTCLMQPCDCPPEQAPRYLTYIKKTHQDKELLSLQK